MGSHPEGEAARSILVTGGFGFIGKHLIDRLIAAGPRDHVHVVDDLRGLSPSGERAHVARMLERWKTDSVTCEISSVAEYAARATPDRFDEVYHLASVVGPVGVLPYAGRITKEIVDDVYHVMGMIRAGGRICYTSTSEVYGGGRSGACAEYDARVVPAESTARAEYGAAKLAAEIALANTARASPALFSAVIVRPFNVAGPGQASAGGFVLPRFIQQALAGEPLTVYGVGDAVRAFTHVADVADGILLAARRGRSGGAYNLGRVQNRTSILDLARLVLRATGSRSRIVHVDPRVLHGDLFAEVGDKYPDGDLAARELGWTPQRDLLAVVEDTVAWVRSERSRPR